MHLLIKNNKKGVIHLKLSTRKSDHLSSDIELHDQLSSFVFFLERPVNVIHKYCILGQEMYLGIVNFILVNGLHLTATLAEDPSGYKNKL